MNGMKTLVWGLTALLATGWTGLVWLTHQITGWLLGSLDSGALQSAGGAVAGLPLPPLPAWLAPWIDTAWLGAFQAWSATLLGWLGAVLPAGDTLMAWIGPLLWVGWAMVLIPMLGVAALLHWLVGRAVSQQASVRIANA